VVSHGTAAAFWGLWDRWPVLIDVIVPCEAGRKIDAIRAHRCRYPVAEEVTTRGGVPCTTPARTLVDVAGTYGRPRLRRFVEEAVVRKLLDFGALDLALHRAKGRRGIRALEAIANRWRAPSGEAPDVRSIFEARILPPLMTIGFEWPECNRALRIGNFTFVADFYWPKQQLIVETDGEATHGTPVAFNGDRRRDQVLMAEGYRATRVTWSHMRDEPTATIRRIRKMLERGPSEPMPPSR
jgi:very-short-patch-repair endonuclease